MRCSKLNLRNTAFFLHREENKKWATMTKPKNTQLLCNYFLKFWAAASENHVMQFDALSLKEINMNNGLALYLKSSFPPSCSMQRFSWGDLGKRRKKSKHIRQPVPFGVAAWVHRHVYKHANIKGLVLDSVSWLLPFVLEWRAPRRLWSQNLKEEKQEVKHRDSFLLTEPD